jgi:hypothetical protein
MAGKDREDGLAGQQEGRDERTCGGMALRYTGVFWDRSRYDARVGLFERRLLLDYAGFVLSALVAAAPTVGTVKSSDGIDIRYETEGSGAPPIVFVHGWSCDRTYWRPTAEPRF